MFVEVFQMSIREAVSTNKYDIPALEREQLHTVRYVLGFMCDFQDSFNKFNVLRLAEQQ